mmetsp:Transcript_17993/g.34798  ORF Transcript_17993/g.34798 Transcript_17993/m.34798 type:complete len:249 (+) Transcript_17993:32-778(+)
MEVKSKETMDLAAEMKKEAAKSESPNLVSQVIAMKKKTFARILTELHEDHKRLCKSVLNAEDWDVTKDPDLMEVNRPRKSRSEEEEEEEREEQMEFHPEDVGYTKEWLSYRGRVEEFADILEKEDGEWTEEFTAKINNLLDETWEDEVVAEKERGLKEAARYKEEGKSYSRVIEPGMKLSLEFLRAFNHISIKSKGDISIVGYPAFISGTDQIEISASGVKAGGEKSASVVIDSAGKTQFSSQRRSIF